jgi:hypothetical protein
VSKIVKDLVLAPTNLSAWCVVSGERDMPEAMLPAGQVGAYLERGRSKSVARWFEPRRRSSMSSWQRCPCRVPGLVSAEAGPGDGTLAFHVRTLYAAGTMI